MQSSKFRETYSAPALVTPAIRMVVLAASAQPNEPDDTWVGIYPVLALQTVAYRTPDIYPHTPEGRWDGSQTQAIIVADPFMGPEDCESAFGSSTPTRTVVCPWDQSEDETRLADMIQELRQEASQKETNSMAVRERDRKKTAESSTTVVP